MKIIQISSFRSMCRLRRLTDTLDIFFFIFSVVCTSATFSHYLTIMSTGFSLECSFGGHSDPFCS